MKKLALAAAVAAASSATFAASPTACTGTCENACGTSSVIGSIPSALVVDTAIRDLMQAQTFGAGSTCIGSDAEACMPGISTAEMNTLFAGDVSNWSLVVTGSSDLLGRCGLAGDTAESQSMLNALEGFAAGAQAGDTAGNFDTCMAPTINPKGADTRRIGVTAYNTAPLGAYDFIKLDGAAPTIASQMSANYNLVANVCNGDSVTIGDGAPVKHSAGANSVGAPARPLNSGVIMPDTP